jgi:16S rRNA (guanine527-N7)-methyltransferase
VTRKGSASDPLAELLAAIPVLAGRPATPEDRRRFARYLELLVQWDRVHGLTGFKQPREIVRGLFLDSLLFLPQLPPRPIRLVDIGSGAGVPGLPLRIVDEGIDLTLIEARRKRASFLSAVQRELGLQGITVVEGRAEHVVEQNAELEGKFDVAVARAITPTAKFLRSCEKYLRLGGTVIVAGPPAVGTAPIPRDGTEWSRLRFPRLGLDRMFLITHPRES